MIIIGPLYKYLKTTTNKQTNKTEVHVVSKIIAPVISDRLYQNIKG